MNRLAKLRAKRAELLTEAQGITDAAGNEDRELTEQELEQIKGFTSQVKAIDKEIETLESLAELERTAPAETVRVQTPQPAPEPPMPSITGGEDRSRQDPHRGFPSWEAGGLGHFLLAVVQAGRQGTATPYVNGRRETRLVPLRAAAGSDEQMESSGQYGGFTVPEGFLGRLLSLEMEGDPTAGVTPVPMSVPVVKVPARVDKNHTSSVAGGLTVSWRPETVAISSSLMSLEQISLTAHSLAGLSYVTNELLQDSAISFVALLQAGFSDAVMDAIIRSRIDGTGVGEPLGILNSPALVSVSTTGQTTGTLVAANFLGMRQRCWRYSTAVWIANHDIYTVLAGVHVAGTNSDSFLFNPARGIDAPDTLLGRPIIFSEYAKSLNTVGDIMLVNWSEYLAGTLQGLQTAESMHVRFANNENTFRFTMRLAGEPWWRSALTPVNSSETLSPYVALATRTT